MATDLRDTDPVRVGDVLIVGRLGEGGMGVVYLGRGPGGGAVAVKVVREELAADPEFRRRFAEEVSAMRDVGAAYAAGVIAADTNAARPWVVMEYVQGMTLAERVGRAGPLPEDELRPFILGLVRAVAAIHAAGVIHRDLKPSNVVLSPQGVRLLDFGVAKSPTVAGQRGERVGSLTWMAPEQLEGKHAGAPADIHAIGMLLYYAATGRHIYGYGDANAVAWRISHIEPQLIDLPPEAAGYGDLIVAALAKDPDRRPSLKAIYDRLRADDIVRGGTSSGSTSVDQLESEETAVVNDNEPPPPGPLSRSGALSLPGYKPAPDADVLLPSISPVRTDEAESSGGLMSLVESLASGDEEVPAKPQWRRRVAVLVAVLVLAWTLGWASGLWPLAGPLAPAAAAMPECYSGAGDADFAARSNFANSGRGEVSESMLGMFPGPLGEFRVPKRAIACQLGGGVTLECPDPNLPDGSDLACTAWDRNGASSWVTITRDGDTWSWTVRN